MVKPGGRYRAAIIALRIPRTQCFAGRQNRRFSRGVKCTYDRNNQPKKGRCESHDHVDPLPPRYLFPLCIARDEKERDEQAYHMR